MHATGHLYGAPASHGQELERAALHPRERVQSQHKGSAGEGTLAGCGGKETLSRVQSACRKVLKNHLSSFLAAQDDCSTGLGLPKAARPASSELPGWEIVPSPQQKLAVLTPAPSARSVPGQLSARGAKSLQEGCPLRFL